MNTNIRSFSTAAVFLGLLAISGPGVPPAHADIDPLTGIDFATITHPGNAPWQRFPGDTSDQADGRGTVNYEYKISKMEITTAQYVEFMSAAFDRPQSEWIPFLNVPFVWGGVSTTPNTPGGLRWEVGQGAANYMVGAVTWRQAAIMCNWYHNGKSLDRSAFLTGAYDVSTFGDAQPYGYTDQRERSAGARYFLPTWDEWLKASHWDPNKQNPDGSVGGWWRMANMRDQVLVYGPPPSFGGDGTGMANAGFNLPGFNEVNIHAGSYPTQLSPWGLLDTAGGMTEWMETGDLHSIGTLADRMLDGSGWGSSQGDASGGDYAGYRGSELPNLALVNNGFRIAAAIPAPGGVGLLAVSVLAARKRRR
jgi:formylglycine-generating enzyme required for sulfatase activity